eukprot:SM000077S21548  [mRNA]  locus=s77:144588:147856:+ [translate_table: standard]
MAAGLVGGSALDDELKRSDVVRLRGLPFSATEGDIADFFKGLELGPDGVVICVNFQGRSTGQAYVQFVSTEQANKALDRNRQHIGSRYIEVFKGHVADMQSALRMVGRGPGGGSLATPGIVGGPGASPSVNGGALGLAGTGIPGMAGNPDMRYTGVIRMRGMPYSCTAADITAFFTGMQIAQDGCFLCTHGDGRPTGEVLNCHPHMAAKAYCRDRLEGQAFVEFVNEETATRAMQLHREPMGSRYVELFRSTKGEMMNAVQQRMYGMYAGIGGGGSVGGIAGMGMGMGMGGAVPNAAGGGDSAENVCVKLRGMPYNAGAREIAEFMDGLSLAPNGIFVVMGPGDRPTGEAYVEFTSPEEAARAMERHRNNMGSRYIELFRATKSEMRSAMGPALASFSMAQLDPQMQLLLLQQQGNVIAVPCLVAVAGWGLWWSRQLQLWQLTSCCSIWDVWWPRGKQHLPSLLKPTGRCTGCDDVEPGRS